MKRSKIIALVILIAVITVAFVLAILLSKKADTNSGMQDVIVSAPLGCPGSTSIIVKSPETSTINITTANSAFLHWRSDQGTLVFSNYTLDLNDIYSNITGSNTLIVIKISHMDQSALTTGTYKKSSDTGVRAPNEYASEFNISTASLAGGVFDNNGRVEIDYIGPDYVCGSVISSDGNASITGDFIARYVKQF